jgi:ribonuclease HI
VCDIETSKMRRLGTELGCCATHTHTHIHTHTNTHTYVHTHIHTNTHNTHTNTHTYTHKHTHKKDTYRQQDNSGVPQKHEKSKSFIRRNQKENCNIEYAWIKAYAGNYGNELADRLVKEAVRNS